MLYEKNYNILSITKMLECGMITLPATVHNSAVFYHCYIKQVEWPAINIESSLSSLRNLSLTLPSIWDWKSIAKKLKVYFWQFETSDVLTLITHMSVIGIDEWSSLMCIYQPNYFHNYASLFVSNNKYMFFSYLIYIFMPLHD